MITRIVGRSGAIQRIIADLYGTRLISIVGTGGVGKTMVALAIAEQMARSFRDGVWLVDFEPLRDGSMVPAAIATAIGLSAHSTDIRAAVLSFLETKELLLVLDNCEHLVDWIAPYVAELHDGATGVRFITTGRQPLRITIEKVHRLTGLSAPPVSDELTAHEALTYPAVELFVECAAQRVEHFKLSDAEAPIVAEMCRRLDGIALAIELAAMRVDVFGIRGLSRQIKSRLSVLAGSRAASERHRTFASTLDWSYDLLSPTEATMLRIVSTFADTFRAADAAAVADLPEAEAAVLLAELASQSMLSEDKDCFGAIYRLLETTRAYCQDRLKAMDEQDAVRLRHAEHIREALS